MNRDPNERGQPDGAAADQEFEAIVAGWRQEGAVPQWPDQPSSPAALLFDPDATREPAEEHFVPPEPPPLPPIGPPAMVGLALLGLGLLLLISPGWVGVPSVYALPLGLVGIAAGLGWLVLRLWPDPPDDSRPDNGAIL